MISELDKKLVERYPKIFKDRYGDMKSTAMCWGFQCGAGWYPLINALCRNLQWNTDHNNKKYVIHNKILRILVPFIFKIIYSIPGKYHFKINSPGKNKQNILVRSRSFLLSKFHKLTKNLKYSHIESGKYPQITATTVKEKYGGLCFYTQGASESQYGAISFAESLSYDICEECGTMKDVGRTEGWIYTRCRECAEKENLMSSWKSNEDRNKETNDD